MAVKSASALRAELLSFCLQYAKLEDLEGDELSLVSDTLLPAIIEYLEGAGVRQADAPWNLYKLVCGAMLLHDYDHRDDTQAQQAYPIAVRNKINQLKIRGMA